MNILITRKSILSGKVHAMSLPITEEQYTAWEQGTLVQDAMPHLTFITPTEWAETFGEE
jgi:uncharacterized protein (DUF779 family)